MWAWWLASNDSKKRQIYTREVIQFYERNIYKNGNLRVCWDLIQVKKFPSLLIMIYQRAIWDVKFVSKNCGMTCQKKLSYWKNYISCEGLKQTWYKSQFKNLLFRVVTLVMSLAPAQQTGWWQVFTFLSYFRSSRSVRLSSQFSFLLSQSWDYQDFLGLTSPISVWLSVLV